MAKFGIDSNMVFDDDGKSVATRLSDHDTQMADIALQVPNSTGGDDTDLIQSYLNLGKTQKRTVLLKPNQTYTVYRKGTKIIRDTVSLRNHGYSLIVPNGVTFDLNGSTIKLANGQDSLILVNENPDATSDANLCTDQNIHIRNGVLDQNNTNQTSAYYQGGIYFAKVQNGSLINLKVINARLDGFRIMGCRNCYFDKLYAKDVQGHGFYIGRIDSPGYDLRLYDCTFGTISGENCTTGFWNPTSDASVQNDGNSIHFMAVNTTVNTLIDKNTSLGIKISGGSEEVIIDKIIANGSPIKFQHTPHRIQVNSINVSNVPNTWAVAFIEADNVQVGKINCYNCLTQDNAVDNVLWFSGTNVSIDDIVLDSCKGGGSVIFRTDADRYNIKHIRMTNCTGSVEIPCNGSITIGDFTINKDVSLPATYRGVNITGSTKLRIKTLSMSGNFLNGTYVVSTSSTDVKIQTFIKEGVNESGRTVTLAQFGSTVISGSTLKYLYTVYGSITLLPLIRFIPVSAAAMAITIQRYKINAASGDITLYHTSAAGGEQFIMEITGYTGSNMQFN
jgi:hypothetical protein